MQEVIGLHVEDFKFTEEDIFNQLKKLEECKAAGPDGIHPRVLKELASELKEPLKIIYDNSMRTGSVPLDWKEANVTPIFKKGDKTDSCNYRPVSVTPIVCRVLERLIKSHVVKFLEKNSLIRQTQHGFIKKKSCETNLLEYLEYITEQMDQHKPCDTIYLDFSKAFDKVPHKRLLKKVEALGINAKIVSWIEDWLANRRQRVIVNGVMSSWAHVQSGVPQGSVLGPLLFLIYINDLDVDLSSNVSKFADDTKIFAAVDSQVKIENVQRDLDKLAGWCDKWQMKFNEEKCKVLHFGRNNKGHTYQINGRDLENVQTEKDLGVLMSENLKFQEQINAVVVKANKMLGFISRTIEAREPSIILPLYRALVRPHLEYCVKVWRPFLKKDIEKLEKVQRRAVNMMINGKISYERKLEQLKLFSLEKRRLRGDLIAVFKSFKGLSQMNKDTFTRQNTNEYNFRGHGIKIKKQHVTLDIRKYFFSQRVVSEWNKLPALAVSCNTLDSFKKHLDLYLKQDSGYV